MQIKMLSECQESDDAMNRILNNIFQILKHSRANVQKKQFLHLSIK